MNTQYKVAIVDDELPICNEIEYLLQAHPEFKVVGKFDMSQQVLDFLSHNECDVIFLDINMPGMTGLEIAEWIDQMHLQAMVIFVTAYEQYALDAFATPAIGYITKPISQIALAKALTKFKNLKGLQAPTAPKAPATDKIVVGKNGKLYPLNRSRIIMAYVKNKEVFVRTKDGDFYSQMNMQEMAEFLNEEPFLQVHRQYIINTDQIAEVVPWFHGSYILHMEGFPQDDIPISRNHIQEVKQKLGFK